MGRTGHMGNMDGGRALPLFFFVFDFYDEGSSMTKSRALQRYLECGRNHDM